MLQNTYVIAIGRSSSSHESVEKRFNAEMLQLRSGSNNVFFSKLHGKYVRVHVEVFVSLQDQPEKRQSIYVAMGNSLQTPRWGYSANLSQVASVIPSCDQCHSVMLRDESVVQTACILCDNWCISEFSEMLAYSPPKHYPFRHDHVGTRTITPKKLTFELLKTTIDTAHNKVISRSWSTEQASAYMEVCGLNEKCRLEVIDRANNCILADLIEENKEVEPEIYEVLIRDKQRNPELYKCWPFPPSWCSGLEMSQHIDAIMHLVFLGVIKTTMKRFNYWTKVRGKHNAMVSFAKLILEGVQELRLQWITVLPYRQGCFSGWVSENFLGMARILPWFYSNMFNLLGDPVAYEPPITPQHKWTLLQNKAWLKSRFLSQKGKAKDLSIKVKHFMTLPQYEHPHGPLGGPVTDVLITVQMLWIMTSHIMARSVNTDHIIKTERMIKLFLSSYEHFDKHLRQSNTKCKPSWLTSSNFLCLLNLPEAMHQFGPLPNLWEGGGQGERVLSVLKPMMSGYKKNWQVNILQKVLNRMALNRVTASMSNIYEKKIASNNTHDYIDGDFSIDSDDDESIQEIQEHNFTIQLHVHYRCYSSFAELRKQIKLGKPISALHLEGSLFALIHRGDNRDQCYIKAVVTDFITVKLGLHYFKVQFLVGDGHTTTNSLPLRKSTIAVVDRTCILLPLLTCVSGGYDRHSSVTAYAIMDSNWQYMQYENDMYYFKSPSITVG